MQDYGNNQQRQYQNDQFHSFGAKGKETPRIGVPESVSPRQPHEIPVSFKNQVEDDVDDGVSYNKPNPGSNLDEQRLSMQQVGSNNLKRARSSIRHQTFKNQTNIQSLHGSQVSSNADPPFRGQSIMSANTRDMVNSFRKGSNAHLQPVSSPPDPSTSGTVTRIQREEPSYRHWYGEQLFFLGGKIQVGINLWQPALTFILINVLMTATLANTMKDLQTNRGGFIIPILVGVILQVAASILLWVTAMKDPASIPSRRFLLKTYQRRIDYIVEEQKMQKYMDILNGRITRMKYCEECDIYRPPRTIHCGLCGCCIERLDHHCPWIGTCVGKRNYKYFLFFLWSVFLCVCYGIIFGAVHISLNMGTSGDPGQLTFSQIISIVIMTLASFLGIFVFFLFGYHQYLLCRNETTNENLKKTFGKLGNPFYRGCFDNIRRLCRRDKRNWKPEEIVVREEERNDSQRHRMSQPRQLMRQSYNSSLQGTQQIGDNQFGPRNSSVVSRNQFNEQDNTPNTFIEDQAKRVNNANGINNKRESDTTNMNAEHFSNHENPDFQPSNPNSQKPISNKELDKMIGVNINESRRAKNRKTSQESEMARKANQEALQKLQSNAQNVGEDDIIQENINEEVSENLGQPIQVNDIKIDGFAQKVDNNIKLPLNNGVSAMNTEQQISVLDQSDEQGLEEEVGEMASKEREVGIIKSGQKSPGIYQSSTTQKNANSNLSLNPNVSNLMNSIHQGQNQYKSQKQHI